MTATDELRRLLDGRGIEWTEPNNEARSHTTYWTAGALRCMAVEFTDGVVSIASSSHDLTPEQAVEATLGSDLKAENEKLREEFDKMDKWHSAELIAAMKENAKLRELVAALYRCADAGKPCETCPLFDGEGGCLDADRIRELGVEVDE